MRICILCMRHFINKRVYNSVGICDSSGRQFIMSHILCYDGIYYISIQFSELKVLTRTNVHNQFSVEKSASKCSCLFDSVASCCCLLIAYDTTEQSNLTKWSYFITKFSFSFSFLVCWFVLYMHCAINSAGWRTNFSTHWIVWARIFYVTNHKCNAPATTATKK